MTVEEQSNIIDIEHGITVKGAIGRDFLGIVKGTLFIFDIECLIKSS